MEGSQSPPNAGIGAETSIPAGIHALHRLLSAIADGRVTVRDLRKASIAKRRREAAHAQLPSKSADNNATTGGAEQDKASPASESSEAKARCLECACTEERMPSLCFDRVLLTSSSLGMHIHREAAERRAFCGSLEAFCCRKAIEDITEMHPCMKHADASPAAWLSDFLLGCKSAVMEECEETPQGCIGDGQSKRNAPSLLYDEEKLFDCFQSLQSQPSEVIHLCFWAASRMVLSLPFRGACKAPFFLRLLESAAPVLRCNFHSDSARHATVKVRDTPASRLREGAVRRAAAAQYVKQAVAFPFLAWWNSLFEELSGEENCSGGGDDALGSKVGQTLTVSRCSADRPFEGRRGKRPRDDLIDRRRSRLAMWRSVLSLIVSKNAKSNTIMCAGAEEVVPGGSELLCSLILPSWEGEAKTADGECKVAFGGRYTEEAPGLLQELRRLLHAQEHLKIQFVFQGPSKTLNEALEEAHMCSPSCTPQASSCSAATLPTIYMGIGDISAWLSWVLYRQKLMNSQLGKKHL